MIDLVLTWALPTVAAACALITGGLWWRVVARKRSTMRVFAHSTAQARQACERARGELALVSNQFVETRAQVADHRARIQLEQLADIHATFLPLCERLSMLAQQAPPGEASAGFVLVHRQLETVLNGLTGAIAATPLVLNGADTATVTQPDSTEPTKDV